MGNAGLIPSTVPLPEFQRTYLSKRTRTGKSMHKEPQTDRFRRAWVSPECRTLNTVCTKPNPKLKGLGFRSQGLGFRALGVWALDPGP